MAWRGLVVAMIIIAACLIVIRYTAGCLVDWALVFGCPLSRRLLDDFRSKSRPFSRCVRGVRHPPVAERIPSVSARRATEESPCGCLSLAINRRSNINRAVGALVSAPPLAFPRIGRGSRPRGPRCSGRDLQLGRDLRFIRQAPYGQSDPLYGKDVGSISSRFPPTSHSRTGCC